MKHLDLFSGYGGFTIPATKYGIETIGFSEIDKYASSLLNYHYPNIKNYGDITKIKAEDLPTVDIITGGSPCQDLSVAGKGAGLNGERSGLFFHFIRLVKEKQPTYFVWENVKGALSSQGGWDFARVQIEMEQAGYDVWWQLINAKDFGVPQNRERIFAIGFRKGYRLTDRIGVTFTYEELQRRANQEKMYWLSEGISSDIRTLLSENSPEEENFFSRKQMQRLLKQIQQGIQEKTSGEISEYGEGIQREFEGKVHEIRKVSPRTQSNDNLGGVPGVVQAPTEEMLFLWDNGNGFNKGGRQDKQQVKIFNDRQKRLKQAIREGELVPSLLSVQPYQERLFYSIGDGTDWYFIYQTKMAKWKTLNSILEKEVDEKYYLSKLAVAKILRHNNKSVQQFMQDTTNKGEETSNM